MTHQSSNVSVEEIVKKSATPPPPEIGLVDPYILYVITEAQTHYVIFITFIKDF